MMTFLDPIVDMIKQADEKELLTYASIFGGAFILLLGLLFYLHYSRVSYHTMQLRLLDKERIKTKNILRDTKLVKAQQQQVEDILKQNEDFRIGQAYLAVINQVRLGTKLVDKNPTPRTGQTISGMTEVLINSTLKGLSMKEVTDFLLAIAKVPQLYTKEITIKKVPGRPTVDIDITVATLEPSLT